MNKARKQRFLACPNRYPKRHKRSHLNKKGLSMIVTTLIVILLVLVAIGIVWVVVKNLIQGGAEGIELSAKCLDTNIRTTAVDCGDPAACRVTFERTGSNNDAIAGVKLVFFNETENSGVIDEPGNIETLVKKTITVDSTLFAPNKIEITAYFKDTSGNEKPCSTTSSNIGVGSSGGEENGGEPCTPDLNPCGSWICGNVQNGTCGEISCGICESGDCVDGVCIECTPNCTDKECGSDGCGENNNCGICALGECIEGICVVETNINSGVVDSVWPPGAVKYFDSDNLPKNSEVVSNYIGKYIKFIPGIEEGCLKITWAEYLNEIEYNKSYLRIEEVVSILSGDEYEIWRTQEGCGG